MSNSFVDAAGSLLDRLSEAWSGLRHRVAGMSWLGRVALGLLVGLPLLWVIAYLVQYQINDDTSFEIARKDYPAAMRAAPNAEFPAQASRAVAMAASLLDREINETVWSPNKPWFFPIAMGDDMQNYQLGIHYAVSRWGIDMADHLGRRRGASQIDGDLEKASGNLKYNPRTWIMDFPSIIPRRSSAAMYNDAVASLLDYNERLLREEAVYDRRADNLIILLQRIQSDLGSQSGTIELLALQPDEMTEEEKAALTPDQRRILAASGGYLDSRADDVFFATKGRLYAYYLLLRETGRDFQAVIDDRNAGAIWQRMLTSLRAGAELYNFYISNGRSMSWFVPSHMTNQGFYLGRVARQLGEMIDILQK